MKSKRITGYEQYVVFEDGRIYSTKSNKFLSPRKRGPERRQYYSVALYDGEGKANNLTLHRIVAEEFIENPENKPIVNHKDNNPFNNSVENLEWVNHSENAKHSYDETNRGKASKRVSQVDKITKETLRVFNSLKEAEEATGVNYTCISKVCSGLGKTAGGYVWRYV